MPNSIFFKRLKKLDNELSKLLADTPASIKAHLLGKSFVAKIAFKSIKAMGVDNFRHDFEARSSTVLVRFEARELLEVGNHSQVDKVDLQVWHQQVKHLHPLFNELIKNSKVNLAV